MEIQIEGNKIFAPLKDKWLVLKPEEEVRQKYICRLVNNYGFSPDQMEQEIQVNNSQRGQGAARADIVVWKSKDDKLSNPQKSPIIIVECKAESVTIHEEDYFQGYNYAAWAGADFFVTTNLKETRIFKVIKGEMPKRLEEIVDIPDAEKTKSQKELCCSSATTLSAITTNFLQKRLLMKSAKSCSLKNVLKTKIQGHRFFLLMYSEKTKRVMIGINQEMHQSFIRCSSKIR